MITTEQFFEDIFGDKLINFRCIKKGGKPKDANGMYNENVISILKQLNEQNYEIYFVVNDGGYKEEQINRINAVFIDLDCGRNENKEYFTLDVVEHFKQRKLKQIQQFSLIPSYVNETRNGLQCFWFVQSDTTIEQFKDCEDRLISFFDADRQVRNPNRLMRVPNYYWCKDAENKFMATIYQRNEVRYDIQELIQSLPEVLNQGGLQTSDKKKRTIIKNITVPQTPTTQQISAFKSSHNKILIQSRQWETLKEQLGAELTALQNHDDVYDYLKRQNLRHFLGVSGGKTFSCLFHKDSKPSAEIYINKVTGHHIYYCYSDNCELGSGKTIIQLTERLTNFNRYKALQFLRNVYNVEYLETEWQKEQKEILEENQRFIMNDEFQQFYQEVYERIQNYIPQLYTLNGIAKDRIVTEKFTNGEGSPLFFASNQYIALCFSKDEQVTSKQIGLFTYLGLIHKAKEEEIPEFLLIKAKHEAAKKNQKYVVNFYYIPSYGELSLVFSTSKANEFKNKGFTMKGFSKEMLYRTLGGDEADRVYPKLEGKPLSVSSERNTKEIEKIMLSLIELYGWTTEKEIVDKWLVASKHVKEKQMKKVMPELLDKYGLVKTRLNGDLKKQINAQFNGFPFIIHKPDLLDQIQNQEELNELENKAVHKVIAPKYKNSLNKNINLREA